MSALMARLRHAAAVNAASGNTSTADVCRRAADAVAELIAAAELMADLMPDAELETDSVQGEIVARLRAALARIGGAA